MTTEQWTNEQNDRLAQALGYSVWVPSLELVFEAQAEVERRGLAEAYAENLYYTPDAWWLQKQHQTFSNGHKFDVLFALINATAEQRAWALLRTLEGDTAT